jgi:adenine-specific DNA-methyltransferase
MPKIAGDFEPKADVVFYEGDCARLLREIPDGFVQLVVTSPPYNLGKIYEKKTSVDEYMDQQELIIAECVRVLDDKGSICWQVGNYVCRNEVIPYDVLFYPIFASLGLKLRNRIVWSFGHGLHSKQRFSGRYEVILWFSKSKDYVFNLDAVRVPQKYPGKKYFKGPRKGQSSCHPLGKNPGDVWDIPNVKANHVEKTIHPCQFPVELVERLVLAFTNEGDWVLDPFMGVGSTAIAALKNGRRAIGAEIMPEYVTVARERVKAGAEGRLRVRPINREIHDPETPQKEIPPEIVDLRKKGMQKRIFEPKEAKISLEGKE